MKSRIFTLMMVFALLLSPLAQSISIDYPPTLSFVSSTYDTTTTAELLATAVDIGKNAGLSRIEIYEGSTLIAQRQCSSLTSCTLAHTVIKSLEQTRTFEYTAKTWDISGKRAEKSFSVTFRGIDSTPPQYSNLGASPSSLTYNPGASITFTVDWADTNGISQAWIEHNFFGQEQRFPVQPISGNTYVYTLNLGAGNINAGNYRWRMTAYDNADSPNRAETPFQEYTISRSDTPIELTISPQSEVSYGTSVTVNCIKTDSSNTESNIVLTINGERKSIPSTSTPNSGNYEIVCSAEQTSNYRVAEETKTLTVNNLQGEVNLLLNSVDGDITVERLHDTVSFEGSVVAGGNELYLYINEHPEESQNNSLSHSKTFPVSGTFAAKLKNNRIQNYASGEETHTITVVDTIVPESVLGLWSTGATADSITIEWTNPVDTDRDFAGVRVYLNGNLVEEITGIAPESVSSYTLQNLTQATSYSISVNSFDTYGNMNTDAGTITASTIPFEEVDLVINRQDSDVTAERLSVITANCTAIAGTGYIKLYVDGSMVMGGNSNFVYNTSYSTTGTHLFRLFSPAEGIYGSSQENHTVTIVDTTEPDSVSNLRASLVTKNSAVLEWQNPDNDDFEYAALYANGNQIANFTVPNQAVSYSLEGLSPSTQYIITMSASDTYGNTNTDAGNITITTLPEEEVNLLVNGFDRDIAVERLSTVDASGTSISGNPELELYIDGAKVAEGNSSVLYSASFNTTGNKTFRLFSPAEGIHESAEESHNVIVHDTTPPSSVSGLAVAGTTLSSFTISWQNPSDDDFTEAIIMLDGANAANSTEASYTFEGLASNTTFTVTIHTIDSYGNINNTDVSVSASTQPDSEGPSISGEAGASDSVYSRTANYTFTADITDNAGVSSASLVINRTSYAMQNTAGSTYSVSVGSLAAANYTWRITASDISGNSNSSAEHSFEISKAQAECIIIASPPSLTYGENLSVSGTCTNSESQIMLFRNGTDVSSSELNSTFILPAGDWTYELNASRTQNYTEYSSEVEISVAKAQSSVSLLIDGSDSNKTVLAGENITITGLVSEGEAGAELFIDNSSSASGASVSYTANFSSEGTHNITLVYAETANYTASSAELSVNVVPVIYSMAIIPSSYEGFTSFDSNITYDITVTNTGTVSDSYTLFVDNAGGADTAALNSTSISIPASGSSIVLLTVGDSSTGSYNVTVTAVSATNSSVNSSVSIVTNVVDYSNVINSWINGTYYESGNYTRAQIPQLVASRLEDSTIPGNLSVISSSDIRRSTVENSTVSQDSRINDSLLRNSVISDCTVLNSTLIDVASSSCHIEDSFIDPSDITGSTITGDSSVINSNVINSTVHDSSVNSSDVYRTGMDSSDVSGSSRVYDSVVNSSSVESSNITLSTVLNSTIPSGTDAQSAWIDSGVVYNGTVNGIVITSPTNLTDLVNYAPEAGISASSTSITEGGSVTFTSISTDRNIGGVLNDSIEYNWTVNGEFASNSSNFTRSFGSTGTYNIGLEVTDSFGASDSGSVSVSVASESSNNGGGGGGSSRRRGGDGGRFLLINITRGSVAKLDLFEGDLIQFTFEGETHTVSVREINSEYAEFTVRSDPVQVKVDKYKTEFVNLDDDSYNDLSIKYEMLIGLNTAKFTIGLMKLPNEDEAPVFVPQPEKKDEEQNPEPEVSHNQESDTENSGSDDAVEEEQQLGIFARLTSWLKSMFSSEQEPETAPVTGAVASETSASPNFFVGLLLAFLIVALGASSYYYVRKKMLEARVEKYLL